MAEENQVEQTTQPDVSRETTETKTEETKPQVNGNSFSEDDVNNIVKQRLAKERASIYKKLDVDDLDMNNPADKKKYAEFRKQRDSMPTKIVLNNK